MDVTGDCYSASCTLPGVQSNVSRLSHLPFLSLLHLLLGVCFFFIISFLPSNVSSMGAGVYAPPHAQPVPRTVPARHPSVLGEGVFLPPVTPNHAVAAVTPDCTFCSREFTSAVTCKPRTPCTPEILDLTPPKAKASALAPQFSSCGPQQASRPGSTASSTRGLQSKSLCGGRAVCFPPGALLPLCPAGCWERLLPLLQDQGPSRLLPLPWGPVRHESFCL